MIQPRRPRLFSRSGANPSRSGVCPKTDLGHRLDLWRGDLPIVLRHDHDAQRLYAPFAAAEIGGVSARFPASNFDRLCGALR